MAELIRSRCPFGAGDARRLRAPSARGPASSRSWNQPTRSPRRIASAAAAGIVGYQYFHGTNADVGRFSMSGTSIVERGVGGMSRVDGSKQPGESLVELQVNYRWNDIIDPNPQYQTDREKSVIAEIISFGQARSYRISIKWKSKRTVRFDERGNIKGTNGWPGAQR